MAESGWQHILRCERCNKPYDKQATLKRHGYHCRSRKAGNSHRARSCISCTKRKTRCNNGQPECFRCITKGINCQYPANTPKGTDSESQRRGDAVTRRQHTAPLLDPAPSSATHFQTVNNDKHITPDSAVLTLAPDLENLIRGNSAIGTVNLWNPSQSKKTDQHAPLRPSSSARHFTEMQYATHASNGSIPTSPTPDFRSLILRPWSESGAQRVSNLILHILKSYPLMMRHKILPPYIHPSLTSPPRDSSALEPLANCISLIHMINGNSRGSRKLFWRNVRMDCECLYEEHHRLSKWQLLAALQALFIYIIVRLDEGETEYNDFDFLLIATVTVIARQLTYCDIAYSTQASPTNPTSQGLESAWKDWVFEESRRRLCVVYRILNMLVYFEPAMLCNLQPDLILAPLPAKKQLWEAGDESEWKTESEIKPGVQTTFGLAANGDLVGLDEGQLSCSDAVLVYGPLNSKTPSAKSARWEEWCSGMDGLGTLVMLAASLVV